MVHRLKELLRYRYSFFAQVNDRRKSRIDGLVVFSFVNSLIKYVKRSLAYLWRQWAVNIIKTSIIK